jgi:hypothetical protein
MKLCSGILKQLACTDDIAFQHKYFRKTSTNIPGIYTPDAYYDEDEEPSIQTIIHNQNKTLVKIAIFVATNASAHELTQTSIDSGAPCCATLHFVEFLHHTTPIKNTTLN